LGHELREGRCLQRSVTPPGRDQIDEDNRRSNFAEVIPDGLTRSVATDEYETRVRELVVMDLGHVDDITYRMQLEIDLAEPSLQPISGQQE
jgi:hypothetical protein